VANHDDTETIYHYWCQVRELTCALPDIREHFFTYVVPALEYYTNHPDYDSLENLRLALITRPLRGLTMAEMIPIVFQTEPPSTEA
jgi:hypothetical protein